MGSARILAQIGKGFAEAMVAILPGKAAGEKP
jgi:hypothetical protein